MPASPSTARAINDRLALGLLQERGPLTAGQLKQLTGLSRPTVADLVERLTAAGLIRVVGESGAARRGPNARLYGIAADGAFLAALDVRTDGVVVLVADLVGRVLAEASVPVDRGAGTGPAVELVVAAVERAAKEAGAERLHTVGIGAPGLIDPATGDLRDSAGLPAWHRSLAAALKERLPGARITVENETNLAALAEQREGAARDRDTFVLLWLGHGTGAAVVLDGVLRRGASGGAGEIGFLPVPGTSGLPSATDCAGGFHALAGAAAVLSLAAAHGLPTPAVGDGPGAAWVVRGAVESASAAEAPAVDEAGAAKWPGEASAGRGAPVPGGGQVPGPGTGSPAAEDGPVPGEGVAGRASGGAGGRGLASGGAGGRGLASGGTKPEGAPSVSPDRRPARAGGAGARFLAALADGVAVGAASVVAVLDPGCVVLGGEVGRAGGEVLAGLVAERLARLSPLSTEVRAGGLGGSAVLRGALLTARDRAQDELWSGAPSRP
ncbi:ROK family transcriptional regulator [Streptomyces sp. NEAU-sy36]|uniref:ROK family transcriptional regulator n=1 Tax=unclassified Streptomyces TaxID=2593676 RepID=UPI0015D62B89|nr:MULTISPECIES: ROK family transcriptional regulator [unclassified Streptomyces]QLJ01457.1 ROK family transcriptional regulator [Streptomyces sp. NEAU-sy36]